MHTDDSRSLLCAPRSRGSQPVVFNLQPKSQWVSLSFKGKWNMAQTKIPIGRLTQLPWAPPQKSYAVHWGLTFLPVTLFPNSDAMNPQPPSHPGSFAVLIKFPKINSHKISKSLAKFSEGLGLWRTYTSHKYHLKLNTRHVCPLILFNLCINNLL